MKSPSETVIGTGHSGLIDEDIRMPNPIERGISFLEETRVSRRKRKREKELGEQFFIRHMSGEVPFSQIHQEAWRVASKERLELSNIWRTYDELDAVDPS